MIVALVSSFFCIFNIILWIVFLSKFKKFFSTDEIIDSAREELNQMIADMNRNAGRNIDIIEDRIKELKAAVAEADRHIAFAQTELERQKNAAIFQQKLDSPQPSQGGGNLRKRVSERYKKNSSRQQVSQAKHQDDSYNLTSQGEKFVQDEHNGQAGLFDQIQNAPAENEIISDSGTVFSVKNEEPPVTKVPVVGPNVAYADSPIEPKRNFSEMVRDLSLVGHSVEEIAVELGRSTTEVQMVLDMGF